MLLQISNYIKLSDDLHVNSFFGGNTCFLSYKLPVEGLS